MDISWIRHEQLVEFELIQLVDEGNDVNGLKSEWDLIKSSSTDIALVREQAVVFIDKLEALKKNINNNSIKSFIEELKEKYNKPSYEINEITNDKIAGGWFGRAAGCLLGKPVEKYRREVIKEILQSNNSYPLKFYITGKGIPEELLKKYPWNKHSGKESLWENLECMTEDDDMNYAMLNLNVLETYGKSFTTDNVAETWLNMLPVMSTFTAERVAYYNLLQLKDTAETAILHNPYREWIGAMIRADVFGWVSPGNPVQAVEMAFNDASLSHTGDGVYAEMFAAALISVAFTVQTPVEALKEALKFIPAESRTSKAVLFGMSVAERFDSWEKILDVLLEEYKDYFWVHAVNNTALLAAALTFSGGDFEKAICCTVMAGLDTDSSAATVGSVIGTVNGFNKLPSKWVNPLKNRIRSSLKGFDNSKLSKLVGRTIEIAKK